MSSNAKVKSENVNNNKINTESLHEMSNGITEKEDFASYMSKLKIEDLVILKGATPEDIQRRAHQLCGQYLGGAWLEIKPEQMELERVSGGFTNQLYRCSLPQDLNTLSDEPKEVVVRTYGPKHLGTWDEKHERFSDTVVSVIMSEKKLGPEIYGLFPGGEIQKYYKGHQFREADENNPLLVKELAQKLARFHALNAPLPKKNNLNKSIVDLYLRAYKKYPIDEQIKEFKLDTFLSVDFHAEFEYLKKLMIKLDSPVVFVHNDFRNSNLLVKDEGGTEGDMIVVVDFEYANFTYRGMDFSMLFNVWGAKKFERRPLPNDEIMRPFFEEYIQENIKIYGKDKYLSDKRNTVESMLLEVKVFHLVGMMYGTVFTLQIDEEEQMEMTKRSNMMQVANFSLANYLHFKEEYNRNKIIPQVQSNKPD